MARNDAEYRRARGRAVGAVHRAVERGDLIPVRTRQCVKCDKPAEQYHHHKGYAPEHQLDIIPVCVLCHKFLRLFDISG
jgi:hypothetical protein